MVRGGGFEPPTFGYLLRDFSFVLRESPQRSPTLSQVELSPHIFIQVKKQFKLFCFY